MPAIPLPCLADMLDGDGPNLMRRVHGGGLSWVLLGCCALQAGMAAEKKTPDLVNVRYGPSKANVFDVWLADSDDPAPLVLFIHGGGFRQGDKDMLPPAMLDMCLTEGYAVISLNYRLSAEAKFPAAMMDCVRAVQFIRLKSRAWHIDPGRIASTGGSAGGGISLWLAFHDDFKDPYSPDPVARESSRLLSVCVYNTPCSFDLHFIKQHIPGRAYQHRALLEFFGITMADAAKPEVKKKFHDASPINFVSKDDPPVCLLYLAEDHGPLSDNAGPNRGVHHWMFGALLKEAMDPLGIPCELHKFGVHPDPADKLSPQALRTMQDFLRKNFQERG